MRTPFRFALTLAGALSTFALTLAPLDAQQLADFAALEAREIGPAGMSGRITAIEALESDPATIYAGAASGGVWKTLNGGTTWEPIFEDQRVAGIGVIAVHQTFEDVVWVGTGEGNPRNSADVGAGIWKSMDGGETFTFLGLEDTRQIHRIALHPTDPDIAWVGAMGPIWSAGEERGVYRTTDGGESWEKILYVDEDTGVAEMVQDPRNPNKIFVAMWSFRRWPWFFESGYGDGSGLYVTHDGGDSWQELGPENGLPDSKLGRMGIDIARSNPMKVYALIEAEEDRGLYMSEDGGQNFELINNQGGTLSRPFYYAEIHVDPQDEGIIYNLQATPRLSTDGGRTFEPIRSDIHSDFHAMWIDPGNPELVYMGNDGGMVISEDRAATFRTVDNIPVGQFYHISVDNQIPYNVYGGMQDNGSWKGPSDVWQTDGIRNWEWRETLFGDGFNSIPHPTDYGIGYGMSQGGNLQRWDTRTGERKGIRPYHPDPEQDLRFHWNSALALDPYNDDALYYGSQFLHYSPDRGNSWQTISPDLTTNDPEKQRYGQSGGITRDGTGAENHTTILTIAPSALEQGVIWVGTDDGNVQLTLDNGGSWTNFAEDLSGPEADTPDPATWVPHIEASVHEAGRAYVVFEDHRRGDWRPWIFRTDDFGQSWENIAEGIDGYVLTMEEDPVNPELLYAGSEFGLWISMDAGDSWTKYTHDFPTVPVRSLVVHPRDHDLVIGTFGRALWVIDDIRPLQAMAGDGGGAMAADAGDLTMFPTPDAYLQRIRAMNGYHFSADAKFKGETRPRGSLLSYWVPEGLDEDEATITILQNGREVRSFDGSADPGMNRVSWNLREDAPDLDDGTEGSGQGPEALPGDYSVRVAVGTVVSNEQPLTLHPDPRTTISMADRRAKYNAIVEGLKLSQRVSAAQRRLGEVNQELGRLSDFIEGRDDQPAADLRAAISDLRATLRDGADAGPVNQDRRAVGGMGSNWDAPNEAERLALERLRAAVPIYEAQVDEVLGTPIDEFRAVVQAAGLELFRDRGGN